MRNQDRQIIDQLQKSKNILITFQEHYRGDALACALALQLFLKKAGKRAHVCAANFSKSRLFSFLPGVRHVRPGLQTAKKFVITLQADAAAVKEITYRHTDDKLDFFITPAAGMDFSPEQVSARLRGHEYDVIVTVGTPDVHSLGSVYHENTDFFFSVPLINIDHRPDNEEYGQINNVNITALATAEIVFDILKQYDAQHIDDQIATCLLAGIMAESKSFKVGSLTPQSLMTAGELIELGADRDLIVRHLYQNRDLPTLKLWGRVLAKLNHEAEGKIIWSSLNRLDFEKTGASTEHLYDVIEELIINIPRAHIITLFTESTRTDSVQVMVYATKNIDAAALIKELGGSGNKDYASFESDKPMAELETQVIGHLKQKLEKLPV